MTFFLLFTSKMNIFSFVLAFSTFIKRTKISVFHSSFIRTNDENGARFIAFKEDLSLRRGQILIAFNKDLSVRRAPFLSFVLMKLLWKTNIFVHYTKVEKVRTNEKMCLGILHWLLEPVLGKNLFVSFLSYIKGIADHCLNSDWRHGTLQSKLRKNVHATN